MTFLVDSTETTEIWFALIVYIYLYRYFNQTIIGASICHLTATLSNQLFLNLICLFRLVQSAVVNAFSRELAQLAELAHTVEPAQLDEPRTGIFYMAKPVTTSDIRGTFEKWFV